MDLNLIQDKSIRSSAQRRNHMENTNISFYNNSNLNKDYHHYRDKKDNNNYSNYMNNIFSILKPKKIFYSKMVRKWFFGLNWQIINYNNIITTTIPIYPKNYNNYRYQTIPNNNLNIPDRTKINQNDAKVVVHEFFMNHLQRNINNLCYCLNEHAKNMEASRKSIFERFKTVIF